MSEQLIFIRDTVLPVLQPYASRISVFGSIVRGEAKPDSDVDLLIKLRPPSERPIHGLKWFQLENQLSDKIGRQVELVSEDAISVYIRPYVKEDCVVLYEG